MAGGIGGYIGGSPDGNADALHLAVMEAMRTLPPADRR